MIVDFEKLINVHYLDSYQQRFIYQLIFSSRKGENQILKSNIIKKGFTISIFILFLGINIATSAGVIVEKSVIIYFEGNTLYVGGNGPGNYSEIQDAIDDAQDGDTVFVFSGIYAADIMIDKSIFLIGENQESTIIEMGDNGITIYADGVTVEKFTIERCGGFWHRSGIYIGSNHNKISNVAIDNNGILNGVFIEDSHNNTVSNNIITNNLYFGIRIEYSSQNIIMKNLVSNVVTNGIILTGSSDNEILLNTVKQCTWGGINLNGYCFDNKIYHNSFINNSFDNGFDEGSNIWDDDYPSGGNYWDDYDGEDNNEDGIGDTPYLIAGGENKDRYPLMKPLGAPETPIIKGPTHGKVGERYEWTFISTDPNGDDVFYWIQWGDGNVEEWAGPYSSGVEVIINHTFTKKGTYIIQAKTKDQYEAESCWGQLSTTMSRNRIQLNMNFIRFLERFPKAFPILQYSFNS